MGLQSQINGAIGAAAMGIAGITNTISNTKTAQAAEAQNKAAAEEEKKTASYGNELNSILGEETLNNPEFKDPEMFNRALDMMEGKKAMMLAQRESVRAYRNQYAPGSEEYNQVEEEGQRRKAANFQEFRASLKTLAKGGKYGK